MVVDALPLTAAEKVDRRARQPSELGRCSDDRTRRPCALPTPASLTARPVRVACAGMELEFTDDQEELRDGVRTVLAGECPLTFVREVVEDGASADAAVEADGGARAGRRSRCPRPTAASGSARSSSRSWSRSSGGPGAGPVAPHHHASSSRVVRELGTAEQRARFLGAVAEGRHRHARARRARPAAIGLAGLTHHGHRDRRRATCSTARRTSCSRRQAVDELVGRRPARRRPTATTGSRACVVAAPPTSRSSRVHAFDATRGLARHPRRRRRCRPTGCSARPGSATAARRRARVVHEAAIARRGRERRHVPGMFDITLDYAKQREQFGVPIGSFQAIKHKFADLLVALERARALGLLRRAHDRRGRRAARDRVVGGQGRGGRLRADHGKEGIQIHGGIGYTWEHDMHLYVRRAEVRPAAVRDPRRAPRAHRRRASGCSPSFRRQQRSGPDQSTPSGSRR